MKKSDLKLIVRKIVREEVAMAINEVITELRQPVDVQQTSQPKQQKQITESKKYSDNSVLNRVLNETANGDEWQSLGGGTYDSSKMNDVVSAQYNKTPSNEVNPNDPMSQFLNKDYRAVMKKVDDKANSTRGI
tara:strand:- start:155 stop:553 length:399 start_codon:yes stop_codon:yes gene_type:complete